MINDEMDIWVSDELLGDESFMSEPDESRNKGRARRRYDRLMEERRLKKLLDDDIDCW